MKHIITTVKLTENEVILIDPAAQEDIHMMEVGEKIVISTQSGMSYIMVDTKSFLGAIKALTTKGERDRLNARDRN